jgi:hypothetical protein
VPCLLDGGAGIDRAAVGDTVLALVPDGCLSDSLSGVLVAVGAAAQINVDGLSDLQLIGGALLADAPAQLIGGDLSLSFLSRDLGLQISVGPFARGGAEAVRRTSVIDGHPVIERLSRGSAVLADPMTGEESLVLLVR